MGKIALVSVVNLIKYYFAGGDICEQQTIEVGRSGTAISKQLCRPVSRLNY